MYELLAKKMVAAGIKANVLQQEDEELYLYAYQSLLAHIISWLSLLLIGLFMGLFWESALYMVFFTPLRIFAGGYHKGDYSQCYIVSVVFFFGVSFACHLYAQFLSPTAVGVLLALCGICVFILAPIADPNKPLDRDEVSKYRRIARMIYGLETVLIVSVSFFLPEKFVFMLAMAPTTAAVLLIFSAVKLRNDLHLKAGL